MPEWWRGFTVGVLLTLLIWQASSSIRRTNARIRELGGDVEYNFKQFRKKRPELFIKKARSQKATKGLGQARRNRVALSDGTRRDPEAITRAIERLDREGVDWRTQQPPSGDL